MHNLFLKYVTFVSVKKIANPDVQTAGYLFFMVSYITNRFNQEELAYLDIYFPIFR